MSVNDTLASLIYLFVFYRECSTLELKTIECVPSFYNEGAKGNDFVQKNKFPWQVDKVHEHVWYMFSLLNN